jgi:ABC-type multidrug transport system fused ATPase/permease subunit
MSDQQIEYGNKVFSSNTVLSTLQKLMRVLNDQEQLKFICLVVLTTISTILEMGSVVMIVPIMSEITGVPFKTESNVVKNFLSQLDSIAFGNILIAKILVLLLVVVIKNLFVGWVAYQQSRFGHFAQARISSSLFEYYLSRPFLYHINKNTSILIRNCAQEANSVHQFVINPLLTIVSETFLIVGICGILLIVQPQLTIVAGGLLGGVFWIFNKITSRKIFEWGSSKLALEAKRIQTIQQGLGAIKEVIMLNAQKYFVNIYNCHNLECAKVTHSYTALQQTPRLILEVLIYVGLLILVAVTMILKNGSASLVPALGLFAAAVFKLLPSANRVSTSYQSMKMSAASLDNLISDYKCEKPEVGKEIGGVRIISLNKEVKLNSVRFSYGNNIVIKDLSLTVRKGELIGIVGESGSGKSTLLNIFLGLISPLSGCVTVDGVDIKTDLFGWQKNVGYVSQNIFLMDDSLRRNIAFGVEDNLIDEKAIYKALEHAQMREFVDSLVDGLETFTGERGVGLSGGQVQRIGIARALYHNPDILVLDEATSALDHLTETSVMNAIQSLYGLKTVIIVSHRVSALWKCDRIYKMTDGQLGLVVK